jgi:dihydroorotate dehydrogenase
MTKLDLIFDPPVLNSAGTLGFSPDLHGPLDWKQFGAFVTNPISLAPRTPAHGERFIAYPGGFLLHSGYPNPGLSQVLRHYARQWSRSSLPVIVHLLVQRPEELARMVGMLEGLEGVGGIEIGFPNAAGDDLVAAGVEAAAGELPVIVRLPFERAVELAPLAIQAGALAVSLAPPRGTLAAGRGELVQGRLYGPAILPIALRLVRELVEIGLPTIAAGGIYVREQCEAMLTTGALAVQVDAVLWKWAGYQVLEEDEPWK